MLYQSWMVSYMRIVDPESNTSIESYKNTQLHQFYNISFFCSGPEGPAETGRPGCCTGHAEKEQYDAPHHIQGRHTLW